MRPISSERGREQRFPRFFYRLSEDLVRSGIDQIDNSLDILLLSHFNLASNSE